MLNAGPEADFDARPRQQSRLRTCPYRGFGKPGPPAARLSGQRVQRQPVGGREGSALHPRPRQSLQLGARAPAGRPLALLGAPILPPERFRIQGRRIEGTGENWPISLADLDPYYSRVEAIFRVSGRKEGWPQFPDGNFVETAYPRPTAGPSSRSPNWQRSAWHRVLEDARRRMGQNGLASSINLLLPDAWRPASCEIVSRTPSCARSAPIRTPAWPTARISSIATRAARCT